PRWRGLLGAAAHQSHRGSQRWQHVVAVGLGHVGIPAARMAAIRGAAPAGFRRCPSGSRVVRIHLAVPAVAVAPGAVAAAWPGARRLARYRSGAGRRRLAVMAAPTGTAAMAI